MADCTIGEIRLFAGNYAPVNWALCEGQLLSVSNYPELYSLLSTMYGGDGRTTFGLPDFRGRLPMHFGTGAGLSPRNIGWKFGTEAVTLNLNQTPEHLHPMQASLSPPTTRSPQNAVICNEPNTKFYHPLSDSSLVTDFPQSAISSNGSGEAHGNIMPSACVNFIIALKGTYPQRS